MLFNNQLTGWLYKLSIMDLTAEIKIIQIMILAKFEAK
jgi:hypothetical protein